MLLLSLACHTADTDIKIDPAPDLTVRLGPGEVRGGEIVDDAALTGGISAEGRIGDWVLYNDRVRFVIQGMRDGDYIVRQGGSVIDADIVRPEGQPGRDLVDEWVPMAGVGHIAAPTSIQVINDGTDGSPAVIAVEGEDSAVDLLEGAVEADIVPDLGVRFRTVYTLPPDGWFLEVETVITASGGALQMPVGDLLIGAKEVSRMWVPGSGYVDQAPEVADWMVFVGDRNEGAVGVFSSPGEPFAPYAAAGLISGLLEVAALFGPEAEIAPGASAGFTRLYGVGPDIPTLYGAWAALQGIGTQTASGAVTAEGAESGASPVAGARVTISVDGAPAALAFTGADGSFSAEVPMGAISFLADGRGTGRQLDRPPGVAYYGPYSTETARAAALGSWGGAAAAIPQAEGFGTAAAESPLTLATPGTLVLTAADGLPFEARISFAGGDPTPAAEGLAQARPEGYAAEAWARDGSVSVPLQPGSYRVLVWRGARYELEQFDVEIAAGEENLQAFALAAAYAPAGWVSGDPHMHAAPSSDAGIPMEDRLTVSAGTGVGLHFGTDHDHVVDYGPLLAPMGLDRVLGTVVASEVSPVLRGHLNMYPLEVDRSLLNGGAWPWWIERVATTAEQFGILRQWNPGAILQLNHPMDKGVAQAASWSEGVISDGDFWSEDFDAVEVNNSGDLAAVPFYHDLIRRGILVAPTAVSDSHGYHSGAPGINVTWFGTGTDNGADDPAQTSGAAIVEAVRSRRTVASRGVFLSLSIPPGSEVIGAQTLTAEALSPSWIRVARLQLVKDGAVVETVEGTTATFALDPAEDAAYSVIASGDEPMAPISGETPWALSSAILVDVAGDGWTPPMPAFEIR